MDSWRAWYGDGSVYDSKSTRVEKLPREDLQVVMVYETPPYRRAVYGNDYIYWNGDSWHGTDDPNMIPDGARVFPGIEIRDATFRRILETAYDTLEF